MGRQILDQFSQILRDLLDDDKLVLESETRREEIPAWDSLSYVNFIIAVEMKYRIRFPIGQIESFETVGEIAQAVENRLS